MKGAGKVNESKENPFESIWSRQKFNILGQKRKNDERHRVGLSRSLAKQKRQKTLLKEYMQNSKSSVFLDKRIGENDEGLEEFDKAILRSQRERQTKFKKKRKFNLSDGEEDDLGIGEGAYLGERDDYEDEELQDGEEAGQDGSDDNLRHPIGVDNGMDYQSVAQEKRHKSKKEVMDDIISKSKFFKAEKAKAKEENHKSIEQLNKDYASLVESKAMLTLSKHGENKDKDSYYYDKLVSEMELEVRARPSDRTKTAEELAQKEKERLERLEEERQKRIASLEDSGHECSETSDNDESGKRRSLVSGDDLGDFFYDDSLPENKVNLFDAILRIENSKNLSESPNCSGKSESDDDDADEVSDQEDQEGSDEADDDGEKNQTLKDWEQSDDEYGVGDMEEKEEKAINNGDNLVVVADQKKEVQRSRKLNASDDPKNRQWKLPYTIEAPKSFEELNSLLENLSDDQILEVIKRIRAYNAISIVAENKKKIQMFYGILLQYFAVLANEKPVKLTLLNMLVKPLMEMSAEIPYYAAICARQRLLRTRTLFCEDLKNTGKSSWPSLKTLCLLRLWCMIFPCSDFRHAVTTPSILLMSEYLMRCPVTTGRDIAVGSLLCSIMLSVSKQSQRYCPEAVTFLQTTLMVALTNRQTVESSQLYHLMELKTSSPLLRMEGHVEEIRPLDFLTLMDLPDDSSYFVSDDFKAGLLSALLGNLKGYLDVYQRLQSFPEIFSPFLKVLHGLAEEDGIPETLKIEIKGIALCIENKCQELHAVRQPLRYQKVKIIKTLAPKFEEKFVKGRDYDPDREKAERKKLKKRLKQEARGAARELRKDNYFLLEEKEKERTKMIEEKAERYKEAMSFLQEQEHAFKSGQLGKTSKGRRRR